MPTPRVIDISHHQVVPEGFEEAKAAGIVAVIHKLTEGSSYVDDKCQARRYPADRAGLKFGVYHFLRPGDMAQQVSHFLDTGLRLGVIDDDTLLVADHEDADVPGEDLKRWLDMVEDAMARSPAVYSGHVLKDQLAGTGYRPVRRLWLCHYSSKPTLPEGIDQYWLWQFTDQGSCPGISGKVDLNDIGDATVEEFLAGWSGAHDAPQPQPEPVAEVTLSSDQPIRIHIGPNVEIV